MPARIGTRLGAQRVDVFAAVDRRVARLHRRWIALGHGSAAFGTSPGDLAPTLPLWWFPWSLGNIRPEEYVFVRNAGPLPLEPGGGARIADLGMSSALHLPVTTGGVLIGAVCAYWAEERSSWTSSDRSDVCGWAAASLTGSAPESTAASA